MMPLWGYLDDEVTGELLWYVNLVGAYAAPWAVVVGIDGGTPGGLPLTYPFGGPVSWPEAWRHAALNAVLRGVTPSAVASSWDLGLYGSGADSGELTAPGYTRTGTGLDAVTDIAASGDPVAGIRANTAHTWSITLTDQDIRGVTLYGDGAEVLRTAETELAGASGAPVTFTVDLYDGGSAFALTGPYGWAAPVLAALISGGSYTPPAAHYLGFMEAFAFTPTEFTAAGYSRKAITFTAPSGGQCTNTAALRWTTGAPWPTGTWVIWDAATGGNILWQGDEGSMSPTATGDRILIDVGAIKARIL